MIASQDASNAALDQARINLDEAERTKNQEIIQNARNTVLAAEQDAMATETAYVNALSAQATTESAVTQSGIQTFQGLVEGGTEHSFGIHVAKMAGMPKQIVDRANEMLHELESQRQQNGDIKQTVKKVAAQNFQLSFFDVNDPKMKRLAEEIENIEVNAMTPIEAIMKLHELKKLLENN